MNLQVTRTGPPRTHTRSHGSLTPIPAISTRRGVDGYAASVLGGRGRQDEPAEEVRLDALLSAGVKNLTRREGLRAVGLGTDRTHGTGAVGGVEALGVVAVPDDLVRVRIDTPILVRCGAVATCLQPFDPMQSAKVNKFRIGETTVSASFTSTLSCSDDIVRQRAR